jgi:hypothetical protein
MTRQCLHGDFAVASVNEHPLDFRTSLETFKGTKTNLYEWTGI